MVTVSAASGEVQAAVRDSVWPYLAAAAVVVGLYVDAWAHNHLVRDIGWWGTFPSRPGPPHFPAGLSVWHLPYLVALAWSGLLAACQGAGVHSVDAGAARHFRHRAAAMGVALVGWLVSTATSGARTPGAGFVRLESLPGLLGPGALLQAGGVVYLGWSLAVHSRSGWGRAAGGWVVLSTLTFLTQFAHPYADPWPSAGFLRTGLQTYRYGLFYFGEAVGVLSLVLQAELAAAVVLAVWRAGPLPAGGWTLLFAANGVLVAALRGHFPFVVSAALTGLVADLLASRVRGRDASELRLLAGCVAGAFCASVFLVVGQMGAVDVLYGTGGGFALPHVSGLGWSVPLWMGTSLLAGGGAWLLAFLATPVR